MAYSLNILIANPTSRANTQKGRQKGRKRARSTKGIGPGDPDSHPVFLERGSFSELPAETFFEVSGRWTISHDILTTVEFQILALLDPSELASLAQTNRLLREMLTGPQSSGLWTAARRLAVNTLEPPPGVSEITWARYLYAPPICDVSLSVLQLVHALILLHWKLCSFEKVARRHTRMLHPVFMWHLCGPCLFKNEK